MASKRPGNVSDAKFEEVRNLRMAGMTTREVSIETGLGFHTVKNVFQWLYHNETPADRQARLAATEAARDAKTQAAVDERLAAAQDTPTRRLERKIRDLEADKSILQAQLREADFDKSAVEQVAEILRNAVAPWDPRPLTQKPAQAGQFEVDAAVSLTDEHGDEVIEAEATWGLERYDFNVFRTRLERWVKVTAAYLTQHLPRYHFDRLWVQKLGDGVHGNLHLPGQKYRNFFGNDILAAVAVGEAEADAIARLADVVPEIIVTCISGNHPRQTAKKDYADPWDNLDYLIATTIYQRLKKYIDEGRVQVHVPRAYSAYQSIRGWVNALNHGDDVIGTWGIPWYGFSKHEARVQAAVATAGQRVDYFWYGHYHTDVSVSQNGARSIHAGAFTRTDDYSLTRLKAFSEPTQVLEVFDDPLGRILEVPIYLRDGERERALWAGEYEPTIGRESSRRIFEQDNELARAGFPLITAGGVAAYREG